jgi:hypothetical protein
LRIRGAGSALSRTKAEAWFVVGELAAGDRPAASSRTAGGAMPRVPSDHSFRLTPTIRSHGAGRIRHRAPAGATIAPATPAPAPEGKSARAYWPMGKRYACTPCIDTSFPSVAGPRKSGRAAPAPTRGAGSLMRPQPTAPSALHLRVYLSSSRLQQVGGDRHPPTTTPQRATPAYRRPAGSRMPVATLRRETLPAVRSRLNAQGGRERRLGDGQLFRRRPLRVSFLLTIGEPDASNCGHRRCAGSTKRTLCRPQWHRTSGQKHLAATASATPRKPVQPAACRRPASDPPKDPRASVL